MVGEDVGYVVVGGQIHGVGGVKHNRQVVFYMVCVSRMVEGKVVVKGCSSRQDFQAGVAISSADAIEQDCVA